MFASLVLGLLVATSAVPDETVTLHFYERPPFMAAQPDGSAAGLTADPAAALFKRAGVPFRWQKTPAKRQLSEIEENTGRDCGVGWFANEQRAGYGAFIGPIYEDRPPVVLAAPGFPMDTDVPIERLLAESRTPILIKDGLSYGTVVSHLIERMGLMTQRVGIEQVQMIRMLAAGRASFMFSTREEADMLLAGQVLPGRTIRVIDLTSGSVGEPRYILCSKGVDPRIILALKAALTT